MAIRNTETGWGLPARLLHWAMAVLILFMLGVGFYMGEVLTGEDSDTLMQKFYLAQTHKSWGFVAFVLALLRIFWRVMNPTPALPDGMGGAAKALAHGGHLALYVCMIAMPLSGWLMSSATTMQDSYGIKNMVFGLFEMPDPFQPGSEELETIFRKIHFYVGLALALILAGHAAAALKHHFVDRDGVLMRMIRG